MQRKLKLYTQKEWLTKGVHHLRLLFPFWGIVATANEEGMGIINDNQQPLQQYLASAKEIFELVNSPEEADAFLWPQDWGYNLGGLVYGDLEEIRNVVSLAQQYQKQILIFWETDSDRSIPIENAIVFKTSSNTLQRNLKEFTMPPVTEDIIEIYCNNELPVRPRIAGYKPIVGFCGQIDGTVLRRQIISRLLMNDSVLWNVVCRPCYQGMADPYSRKQNRLEYIRNILTSDYALVIRGAGNFSYRFYEVLSCGRIPVFINTDCGLPFDNIIDWKKYGLWIDIKEIDLVGEKIALFHSSLSNDEFINMQIQARLMWLNWIRVDMFYRNIWRQIVPFINR